MPTVASTVWRRWLLSGYLLESRSHRCKREIAICTVWRRWLREALASMRFFDHGNIDFRHGHHGIEGSFRCHPVRVFYGVG